MSYMSKKTNKRQSAVVSLSDKNQEEIQKIAEQKRQMMQEYESKKAGTLYNDFRILCRIDRGIVYNKSRMIIFMLQSF